MPLVAFCLRHFLAAFIICTCEFDFRQAQPLIDPLAAAVSQAQTLARLKPRAARAGRFARPGPKPTEGLTPALGDWIEHRVASDAPVALSIEVSAR